MYRGTCASDPNVLISMTRLEGNARKWRGENTSAMKKTMKSIAVFFGGLAELHDMARP